MSSLETASDNKYTTYMYYNATLVYFHDLYAL